MSANVCQFTLPPALSVSLSLPAHLCGQVTHKYTMSTYCMCLEPCLHLYTTSAYMHTRSRCVCTFDWMCFLFHAWLRLQYIVWDFSTVKGPLQYLEHLRHKRSFHLLLRVSWIIDWASGCTVLSHRLWVVCIWSLIIWFPTFLVSCAPPAPSDDLMDTFVDTALYYLFTFI